MEIQMFIQQQPNILKEALIVCTIETIKECQKELENADSVNEKLLKRKLARANARLNRLYN